MCLGLLEPFPPSRPGAVQSPTRAPPPCAPLRRASTAAAARTVRAATASPTPTCTRASSGTTAWRGPACTPSAQRAGAAAGARPREAQGWEKPAWRCRHCCPGWLARMRLGGRGSLELRAAGCTRKEASKHVCPPPLAPPLRCRCAQVRGRVGGGDVRGRRQRDVCKGLHLPRPVQRGPALRLGRVQVRGSATLVCVAVGAGMKPGRRARA